MRKFLRKHTQTVLLVSTSVLVCILISEGALRYFSPVAFHEWMEWEPDGHIKGRGRFNSRFLTEDGFPVTINSLGFRGPEPSWQPAPGVFRILLFGGSAAFAYHAQGEENTWAKLLQAKLSAGLQRPVEVINLALPGFDSATSVRNYLSSGRLLHPHAVMLYETWNDLKFFRSIPEHPQVLAIAPIADHNKMLWQRIARHSQIAIRIRNALLLAQKRKRENTYTSLEALGASASALPSKEAIAWGKKNFEDFRLLANSDGVLPILVSQANLLHAENIENPEVRIAVDNDLVGMTLPVLLGTLEQMAQSQQEICTEAQKVVCVDAYHGVAGKQELFEDHVHLRQAGNEVLADTIAQALLASEQFRAAVANLPTT